MIERTARPVMSRRLTSEVDRELERAGGLVHDQTLARRMEAQMAGAKIVVLYPFPKDVDAFEQAYTSDHVPMVTPEAFAGIQKFVASRVLGTADGSAAPYYRLAELHFPTLDALKAAASSGPAQKAVAHAISISSGGPPIFLIAEEEVTTFR